MIFKSYGFDVRRDEFFIEVISEMHRVHGVSDRLAQRGRMFLPNIVAAFVCFRCVTLHYVDSHQLVVKDGLVIARLQVLTFFRLVYDFSWCRFTS